MYESLVMPILYYAAPLWSTHIGIDIKRLESVQHVFLRYLAFKTGNSMEPYSHDY